MATYRIQGPDGKNYAFDAPPGLSPQQLDIIKGGLFEQPEPEPIAPPAPKGQTGFIPSIMRGGRGIYSLLGDVAPAMLGKMVGAEDYAKRQMQEAAEYQKETERLYPAEVASFTDIKDVGSALTYIKEAIGEAIPSIIPSILTGGAAAVASRGAQAAASQLAARQITEAAAKGALTAETVEATKQAAIKAGQEAARRVALQYEVGGTLAGSAAQNIPEVYQNLYEKAEDKQLPDLAPAIVAGGFNAVLDAILPIQLLRKSKLSGIPDEQIIGAWYKRAGIGAAKGFFTEGGTEALQEMSSAAAESFVNQNAKFFTPENFVRFIDAGLKGGFGGAAITGVSDVAFGRGEDKPAAGGVEPGAADALAKTLGEGETDVTQPQPKPSGAGVQISEQPTEPAAPAGVTAAKQPRVVPVEPDAAGVDERAAEQPAAVKTAAPAPAPTSTPAPTAAPVRENYWRPNPREPENKNSWQDTFGFVHYDVNHPLPKGGRVVNLVDGQQGERILLDFINSKGETKTVSLQVSKGKVPYWTAGDLSEEQLKNGLGEELYNLAGKEPVEDYEAFFNKVRAAVTPAPTPAPAPTEAAAPAPIPEGYKPYSEWMEERKKAMPPAPKPEPAKPLTKAEQEERRKSIKKEILKDEAAIGKQYDQERSTSRFEDEATQSLYDATSKGELPADMQPGTRRFEETLRNNGLVPDLYELPAEFSNFTTEQKNEFKKGIAKDVYAELEANRSKRSELPEWNKMTRDGKDVFLANMTENTPEERARARAQLRTYLNRVAEVQGTTRTKTKASPEARIYETNRRVYDKFEQVDFPAWNELTDEQRKLFETSVRKYSPDKKSARGTSVQHDFAFKALGDNLKEEQAKRKTGKKATEVPRSYELAQKEIAAKEEEKKKKAAEPTKAEPLKRRPTDEFLPDPVIKHVKDGNIGPVLDYLRMNATGAGRVVSRGVARAVAQRIFKLGLKTKIRFVEKLPKNHVAEYDPQNDVISLTMDGMTEATLLHELAHAATIKIINKYLTGDRKGLTEEQIDSVEHLLDIMKVAKKEFGESYPNAFKNIYEFVSYALSDVKFQLELSRMSTENIENTIFETADSSLWSEFLATMAKLFDAVVKQFKPGVVKETNALAESIAAIENIMSVPEGGVEMAPLPATLTAPEGKAPSEYTEDEFIAKVLGEVTLKERGGKALLRNMFTKRGYNQIVTKLQNDRRAIKLRSEYAEKLGILRKTGEDVNDVDDQITRSTGMATHLFFTEIENLVADVHSGIEAYAKKRGKPIKEALAELHLILEARHEPERRLVKFLKKVPLDDIKMYKVKGLEGTRSAAGWREYILEQLTRNDLGKNETERKAKVEELRKVLDAFALDPKGTYYAKTIKSTDAKGRTKETIIDEKAAEELFDYNSETYSVIGNRTSQDIARIKKAFDTKSMEKEINAVADAVKAVNEKTIELNKEANYWSIPTQNIKDFYGYENYVPFKGRPGATLLDEDLDLNSRRLGGELQDLAVAFEGRMTESENPLLQSLAEGAQAAMRAGRKDLTLAIKNAIKDKIINGAQVETIQFADRYLRGEAKEKMGGPDKIFHYNTDGTIDILKINNKEQLEAIRRSYREAQPLIDIANSFTSLIGQSHTRYNPAFAPMNFVRDSLTNAWLLGAELGPAKSAQLISAVASDVVSGGLYRSMNFARLYANGNFDEIRRLAGGNAPNEALDSKQRYYRDLYDYVQMGGKVSYLQGVAAKGALDGLLKEVGRSGIVKKKEQVDKFFDIYNDMFELAARVSAYRMLKEDFRQNAKNARERDEAQVRAVSMTKNLANFEQVGQWGKAAGAAFMFFRPAATGAVRAIDALAPAFGFNEENFREEAKAEGRTEEQIETALKKKREETQHARRMAAGLAGAGVLMYFAAMMMAGDDEEKRNRIATDDMARWTRYARFFIPGFESPIQIPWGFGPGAFAAAGAQIASLASSRTRFPDAMANIMTIGLDSFLPLPFSRISPIDNFPAFALDSITPSAFRPFFEYVMNLDGLGREIYNNRQSRYGDAYTGGDNIPELYKSTARWLFNSTKGGVDWSPNTLYFFANNYIDGFAKAISSGYNLGLTLSGQKDFDAKNDALFLSSFIGTKSNVDAREFSKAESYIKGLDKRVNALRDKPMFAEYARENPEQIALVQIYNQQVNGGLRQLRQAANQVRVDPNLTVAERKARLEQIINLQNATKRNILAAFEAVSGYRP